MRMDIISSLIILGLQHHSVVLDCIQWLSRPGIARNIYRESLAAKKKTAWRLCPCGVDKRLTRIPVLTFLQCLLQAWKKPLRKGKLKSLHPPPPASQSCDRFSSFAVPAFKQEDLVAALDTVEMRSKEIPYQLRILLRKIYINPNSNRDGDDE